MGFPLLGLSSSSRRRRRPRAGVIGASTASLARRRGPRRASAPRRGIGRSAASAVESIARQPEARRPHLHAHDHLGGAHRGLHVLRPRHLHDRPAADVAASVRRGRRTGRRGRRPRPRRPRTRTPEGPCALRSVARSSRSRCSSLARPPPSRRTRGGGGEPCSCPTSPSRSRRSSSSCCSSLILSKTAWKPILAGPPGARGGDPRRRSTAAEKANADAQALLAEYETRLATARRRGARDRRGGPQGRRGAARAHRGRGEGRGAARARPRAARHRARAGAALKDIYDRVGDARRPRSPGEDHPAAPRPGGSTQSSSTTSSRRSSARARRAGGARMSARDADMGAVVRAGAGRGRGGRGGAPRPRRATSCAAFAARVARRTRDVRAFFLSGAVRAPRRRAPRSRRVLAGGRGRLRGLRALVLLAAAGSWLLPAIGRRVRSSSSTARLGRVPRDARDRAPVAAGRPQALDATRLRAALGKEPVVDHVVRPELVGGAVVRVGDVVADGSVRRRLVELERACAARAAPARRDSTPATSTPTDSPHALQSRRDHLASSSRRSSSSTPSSTSPRSAPSSRSATASPASTASTSAMAGEMLEFENGVRGPGVQPGRGLDRRGHLRRLPGHQGRRRRSSRTGRLLEVPVGDALIGRVVNPLGHPLDGKGPIAADEHAPDRHRSRPASPSASR